MTRHELKPPVRRALANAPDTGHNRWHPDLPPALHGGKRYPQIAWPQAKLYDRTGRFIGFLMPEINFARSTSLVNLLQKNSRRVEKLAHFTHVSLQFWSDCHVQFNVFVVDDFVRPHRAGEDADPRISRSTTKIYVLAHATAFKERLDG